MAEGHRGAARASLVSLTAVSTVAPFSQDGARAISDYPAGDIAMSPEGQLPVSPNISYADQAKHHPCRPADLSKDTPPSPQSTEINVTTKTVSAQQRWMNTEVDLKAGDKLLLKASGQWTNGGPSPQYVGPEGFPGPPYEKATLKSANFAALIGKVGDQGEPFFVGSAYQGTRPETGRLCLQINDVPNDVDFADNRGEMVVEVEVTADARPKLPRLVLKQYYSYTDIYEVDIPNGHVVNFTEMRPGESFCALAYYIENHGEGELRLDGMTLGNTVSFLMTDDVGSPSGRAPSFPITLPPGGRKIVFVVYYPRGTGSNSTSVQLRTNDPANPVRSFTINVAGGPQASGAKLVVKQYYSYTDIYEVPMYHNGSVTFREHRPGDPFTALVYYIENQGRSELRLNSVQISNTNTFMLTEGLGTPQGQTPHFPVSIPPGGRYILYLVFLAQRGGSRSTSMTLRSNDTAQPEFTFQVTVA